MAEQFNMKDYCKSIKCKSEKVLNNEKDYTEDEIASANDECIGCESLYLYNYLLAQGYTIAKFPTPFGLEDKE